MTAAVLAILGRWPKPGRVLMCSAREWREAMRYPLAFFVAAIISGTFCSAEAQMRACPVDGNYSVGFDGCYHRYPEAVIKGCVARNNDCGHKPSAEARVAAATPYTLATPSQVAAQLDCDMEASALDKSQAVDITKALITADLTFSMVTKTTSGASLAVGAIPVFAGGNIAPSLSLSSIRSATYATTRP